MSAVSGAASQRISKGSSHAAVATTTRRRETRKRPGTRRGAGAHREMKSWKPLDCICSARTGSHLDVELANSTEPAEEGQRRALGGAVHFLDSSHACRVACPPPPNRAQGAPSDG